MHMFCVTDIYCVMSCEAYPHGATIQVRSAGNTEALPDIWFCGSTTGVLGWPTPTRCQRGRSGEHSPWYWFCCGDIRAPRWPVRILAPATFPARSTARSAPWLPCPLGFLSMWKESIWGLYHVLSEPSQPPCVRVDLVFRYVCVRLRNCGYMLLYVSLCLALCAPIWAESRGHL